MSRALALIAQRRAAVQEELAAQRRAWRERLRWPMAARKLGASFAPPRVRTRVVVAVVIGAGLLGLFAFGRRRSGTKRQAGRDASAAGR